MKLRVIRLGFYRADDPNLGPEDALADVLGKMEAHGHTIVSVSVINSHREGERYEAFIVSRHD